MAKGNDQSKRKQIMRDSDALHIVPRPSLSSAEVSRIPLNSFQFSVVLRGSLRETSAKKRRNSARLVEIMLKPT